jgi:hypothetical protein
MYDNTVLDANTYEGDYDKEDVRYNRLYDKFLVLHRKYLVDSTRYQTMLQKMLTLILSHPQSELFKKFELLRDKGMA